MALSWTLSPEAVASPDKTNATARQLGTGQADMMQSQVTGNNTLHTPEQRHYGDLTWNYLPIKLLSSDDPTLLTDFQTFILPLVRPQWTSNSLGYRVFEDGVTNKLYGFFQVGRADDDMVLVRVNGGGRELVVDARMEIVVMLTLHRAGLSPPLYLVTENAVCYGFIPGRTLSGGEMQVIIDVRSGGVASYVVCSYTCKLVYMPPVDKSLPVCSNL